MLTKAFRTDAAAATGTGIEIKSLQTQVIFSHGIRILALKQPAGAVLANDADWQLWTDYKDSGYQWSNESLNPVNDGGVKLGPTGITIKPNTPIMFNWLNQGAAQANTLEVYYEPA
jgi:hypothetical protein